MPWYPASVTSTVDWRGVVAFDSVEWVCHYCGNQVGSDKGYFGRANVEVASLRIYICPRCKLPTVFSWDMQWHSPSAAPGRTVEHLPDLLATLYDEAKLAAGAGAHTASVMACRTILMYLAVEKKAETNKPFAYYVDYLEEHRYFSPETKKVADYIRKRGNAANHEIALMTDEDSDVMLFLVGHILEAIYDTVNRIPSGPWDTKELSKT
jgi:hypothetical protein